MIHRLVVIAKDSSSTIPIEVFYDKHMRIGDIVRDLRNEGLEFQYKETTEHHHGEEFAEQYGDELANRTEVDYFTLDEFAGNALDFFCMQEYPELD